MKLFLISFTLAFISLSCEFAAAPTAQSGYPATFDATKGRLTEVQTMWSRFTAKYGISNVNLVIDSVNGIPDWHMNFNVDLFPDKEGAVTLEEVRPRLQSFMETWSELFNLSIPMKELYAVTDPSGFIFRFQKSFPYFAEAAFQRFDAVAFINTQGVMRQFSSECPPTLFIPSTPAISGAQAKSSIIGREVRYFDWTGETKHTVTQDKISDSKLCCLVLSPTRYASTSRRIEYRLVWELKVPVVFLYVDAITGEPLNYVNQYIIF